MNPLGVGCVCVQTYMYVCTCTYVMVYMVKLKANELVFFLHHGGQRIWLRPLGLLAGIFTPRVIAPMVFVFFEQVSCGQANL